MTARISTTDAVVAPQDTKPGATAATPSVPDEAAIRHHERQLCALEVLIAASRLGCDASPMAIAEAVRDRTDGSR